jgi:hypothetical protein
VSRFGVISVTSCSLTGVKPTPSNRVVAIPEPESYALVPAGLGVVAVAARRRAQR